MKKFQTFFPQCNPGKLFIFYVPSLTSNFWWYVYLQKKLMIISIAIWIFSFMDLQLEADGGIPIEHFLSACRCMVPIFGKAMSLLLELKEIMYIMTYTYTHFISLNSIIQTYILTVSSVNPHCEL